MSDPRRASGSGTRLCGCQSTLRAGRGTTYNSCGLGLSTIVDMCARQHPQHGAIVRVKTVVPCGSCASFCPTEQHKPPICHSNRRASLGSWLYCRHCSVGVAPGMTGAGIDSASDRSVVAEGRLSAPGNLFRLPLSPLSCAACYTLSSQDAQHGLHCGPCMSPVLHQPSP